MSIEQHNSYPTTSKRNTCTSLWKRGAGNRLGSGGRAAWLTGRPQSVAQRTRPCPHAGPHCPLAQACGWGRQTPGRPWEGKTWAPGAPVLGAILLEVKFQHKVFVSESKEGSLSWPLRSDAPPPPGSCRRTLSSLTTRPAPQSPDTHTTHVPIFLTRSHTHLHTPHTFSHTVESHTPHTPHTLTHTPHGTLTQATCICAHTYTPYLPQTFDATHTYTLHTYTIHAEMRP